MKRFRIINIVLLLLILTGSCKKYVDGYDKDPNGLLETNPEQIMQGVMLEMQFFLKDDGMRIGMLWMNQATGSDRQFVAFNNWNSVGNNQFNNPWSEVYTVLAQARIMEKLSDEQGNIQLRGLAKLYRAWAGGEAASLWGDVPFEQAGLDEYPNPAYEPQADVFNKVQALLDDAIADLSDPVGVIYLDKDLYYQGDVNKWIKVAHGLKARFYLHSKEYDKALTEAQLGLATEDDDMIAPYESYTGSYGKWNPTFQFYWNRDLYLSAQDCYGVEITHNGGRDNAKTMEIVRAYHNYAPGNWWGTPYDYDLNILIEGWMGANSKFGDEMRLISYGEMLLIQAEAGARENGVAAALPIYNQYRNLLDNGYDTGGYESLFGLTLPLGFYNDYDITDFQASGMENTDNVSELQAFLREVMEERYVYFIGDLEAFSDYLRTHNDADVPQYFQLKTGFDGEPLRFIYPQAEIDANDSFPGTAPAVTEALPMYQ
jgi:hypothetical protein